MFRPKTFSETIRPILVLNILCGTGSIVLSKGQKVRKCVEGVYMVSAVILTYLTIFTQGFYKDSLLESKVHPNTFLVKVWTMITYQLVTVLIFVTKFKLKITQDLIEAVDKIDQKMEKIGLLNPNLINYKHQIYHLIGWLAYVTVGFMAMWIFRFKLYAPIMDKIILVFTTTLIQVMFTTVQISFTVWIGHIRMNFRQLNNLLEEMIETTDHLGPKPFLAVRNSQVQKRKHLNAHADKGNVETIAKAKNYHLDLIKIARRINKFYGMQLLLLVFISLISIVALLYMFSFCIWESLSTREMFYELCPVVIWLIITMSRLIHLHSTCVQTSNEAGVAGFLLCRLYNSSSSRQFRSEIQQFTSQVLANPLVFNVCGFVDINRTFITSLVGSIFTYLIVIVQLAGPQAQQRQDVAANATDVSVTANYI